MKVLKPAEIKKLREGLGMSQAAFARAFHLKVGTLQSWEGGAPLSSQAAVLLFLISVMPQAIIKALKST